MARKELSEKMVKAHVDFIYFMIGHMSAFKNNARIYTRMIAQITRFFRNDKVVYAFLSDSRRYDNVLIKANFKWQERSLSMYHTGYIHHGKRGKVSLRCTNCVPFIADEQVTSNKHEDMNSTLYALLTEYSSWDSLDVFSNRLIFNIICTNQQFIKQIIEHIEVLDHEPYYILGRLECEGWYVHTLKSWNLPLGLEWSVDGKISK
jgi:hypothetical protein